MCYFFQVLDNSSIPKVFWVSRKWMANYSFFYWFGSFLKWKLHSQNSKIIWQNSLTVLHNTKAHVQKPKLFTHSSKLSSLPVDTVSVTKMQRSFCCFGSFLETGRTFSTLLVLFTKITWMVQHNTMVNLQKLVSLKISSLVSKWNSSLVPEKCIVPLAFFVSTLGQNV